MWIFPSLQKLSCLPTANATIATILCISLPHAEDSALVDYQQFLTGTENLEEGPADLAVIEDQASHLVGEGRHTETTPTAPSSSGPVTAPHRMVAEGDSSDVEDIIPHHTGTRPATLCLLIPIMKVNFKQIRHLDGQRSFHTMLQLATKQGYKSLLVKVDSGANVKTIPLRHYRTLFPSHFTSQGHPKKRTLLEVPQALGPPHNGHIQQFLGYFTIDVKHKPPQDHSLVILCR